MTPTQRSVLLTRLEQLGPVQGAGQTYRAPCPICNRGRGDSALSIRLEGERVLMHCHRCESSYLELLDSLGLNSRDLYPSSDWTPPARVELTPNERHRAHLERLWGEAEPLHRLNLGGRYLESRGLVLERYPLNVRIHGLVDYWEGGAVLATLPALLSRVENRAGELVALHRTYLDPSGSSKAAVSSPKKLSKPVFDGATKGAAIQLHPVQTGGQLALCEGLETALAVRQVTGWAVWACVSASGLEAVDLPSNALEVIVCADHDARGLQAAHTLARRAIEAGLIVRLAVPPLEGQDWLDVMLEERGAVVL